MMTQAATARDVNEAAVSSDAYERFAAVCVILTGATGFLYSVAFVVLRSDLLSAARVVEHDQQAPVSGYRSNGVGGCL